MVSAVLFIFVVSVAHCLRIVHHIVHFPRIDRSVVPCRNVVSYTGQHILVVYSLIRMMPLTTQCRLNYICSACSFTSHLGNDTSSVLMCYIKINVISVKSCHVLFVGV